jgi:AAA+ ATPase superfamily predicted ATPase
MSELLPPNPFVVGKYVSERYFCDREEETDFLVKQIKNGRNVALIAPRRMGKSDLIHHFFNQADIRENYYVFFVDIYATTSLSEFVYTLGKEIYEQLKPRSTVWKEKFFQMISSLRVGFKLDSMTGSPTFDLGLGDIQSPQTTLDEIFAYINEADKPCIIAIDEFQQIGEYTEKNVEALLRTKIQRCQRAQFVFSGSKRHMMSNMFNSSSKPFYQSAITMGLEPIPMATYTDFAIRLFEEDEKHLEPAVVNTIWQQYHGYTWFVQMMMNELYALTPSEGNCHSAMIADARRNVILSQESSYKDLMSNLPPRQKIVLQAIAKEGIAQNITSSKFIKKYNINSASSVQAAVKNLLKDDFITQEDNTYRVYDFFFSEWLATMF